MAKKTSALCALGVVVCVLFGAAARAGEQGAATPMWNACREACDRQFERDWRRCERNFRTVKQCREDAKQDYAACLAPCPPEAPPPCPG